MIKSELDKPSGLLKVDRVLQTSSSPPTLYGMIPRTYCGKRVAALSAHADVADGDPLDICVFSERPIDKADILPTARVLGGLKMIDDGEADDKIVAVLANDPVFDDAGDLNDLPVNMIDRLDHYFKTYKAATSGAAVRTDHVRGRERSRERRGQARFCAEPAMRDTSAPTSSVCRVQEGQ